MSETDVNGKLDVLIDQVGRLTEGLTEMRAMSREQLVVAQSQAESVKQLVETVRQQAETAKQQAETNARQTQLLETLIGRQ
jgi:methyl-accepting chemotaxis protein